MNGQSFNFGLSLQPQLAHPMVSQHLGAALAHLGHMAAYIRPVALGTLLQHDLAREQSLRSQSEVDAIINAPVLHLPVSMAHQQHLIFGVLNGTVYNALSHVLGAVECCCQVVVDSSVTSPVFGVPQHLAHFAHCLVHAASQALHVVQMVQRVVHGGLTHQHVAHFIHTQQHTHANSGHTGATFFQVAQVPHGAAMQSGVGVPATGVPPQQLVPNVGSPPAAASHNGAPLIGFTVVPVYGAAAQEGQVHPKAVELPHRHNHIGEHDHAEYGGRLGNLGGHGFGTGSAPVADPHSVAGGRTGGHAETSHGEGQAGPGHAHGSAAGTDLPAKSVGKRPAHPEGGKQHGRSASMNGHDKH